MHLIVDGFGYDNEEFFKHALQIRNLVLVDELGFDKHLDFDGKDFKAMHYILFLDDKAIGCARWTDKENVITIDRFCILKSHRKKGYGILMIKFILDDIKPSKKAIRIIADENGYKFFVAAGFTGDMIVEKLGNKEIRILNYL